MPNCNINPELRFNRTFGCGYPSDPATKAWLQNCYDQVFGFPSIVRFSWSTAKKMLVTEESKKDLAYWFDLIDEEKKKKGTAKESKSQTKL